MFQIHLVSRVTVRKAEAKIWYIYNVLNFCTFILTGERDDRSLIVETFVVKLKKIEAPHRAESFFLFTEI